MWLSYALMWFYLCFSCLVRVHWFYWTSGFIVFIKYVKCSVIYVLKYFFFVPPSKSFPSGIQIRPFVRPFDIATWLTKTLLFISLYPHCASLCIFYVALSSNLLIFYSAVSNMQLYTPMKFSFPIFHFSCLEFPVGSFLYLTS